MNEFRQYRCYDRNISHKLLPIKNFNGGIGFRICRYCYPDYQKILKKYGVV